MISNQAKLSMSGNDSSDHSESFSSRSAAKSSKVLSRQSESKEASQDRQQLPTDARYADQAIQRNAREPDQERQRHLTQFLPHAERYDFFDFGYTKPMNRWDRFHSCHLEDIDGDVENSGGYMNADYSRNTPWFSTEDYYASKEGNDHKKQPSYSASCFESSPAIMSEEQKRRAHYGLMRQASTGSKQQQTKDKEEELESTNDRVDHPKEGVDNDSESSLSRSKAVKSPKRDNITPVVGQVKLGRPRMMSEMVKPSTKRFDRTPPAKLLRKLKVNSDIKIHKRKTKYKRSFNDDPIIGTHFLI
jgi:hypothetical protein